MNPVHRIKELVETAVPEPRRPRRKIFGIEAQAGVLRRRAREESRWRRAQAGEEQLRRWEDEEPDATPTPGGFSVTGGIRRKIVDTK